MTEADRAIVLRSTQFSSVCMHVEALRTVLNESKESRKLPDLGVLQSSSAEKLPLPVSQPTSLQASQNKSTTYGKINYTCDASGASAKPHPLSSSSSTPNMNSSNGCTGTFPPRQTTTSHGLDRVSDHHGGKTNKDAVTSLLTSSASSARTKPQRSSGGPTPASTSPTAVANEKDKENDDGDIATAGSMTYVTELDYQDLVEQISGRPWPKILNVRKMASVEESNAGDVFKQDLKNLNVTLVKAEQLVFHSLLGRGSSANVYQGMLSAAEEAAAEKTEDSAESPEEKKPTAREVAIKILNTSPTDLRSLLKAHKETMDELLVMQRVQSPNVVRLFGITFEPSICIVLEFCHKGSLYDVLCTDMKLTWSQCIQWFREIAIGTLALHSSDPPIVHRDLKTLNLLVDDTDRLKVADFGLSRLSGGTPDQLATLQKMRGTYVYCAPEIYFGLPYSELSDVYSIGLIFWELVVKCVTGTYQRPFGEYPAVSFGFQVVIMASRKGTRPTIPSCPKTIQNLLRTLWCVVPSKRPTCAELLTIIDEVEREYLANKDAWDNHIGFVPEFKDEQIPPPEMTGSGNSTPTSASGATNSSQSTSTFPTSSKNGTSSPPKGNSKDNFTITSGSGNSKDTTTTHTSGHRSSTPNSSSSAHSSGSGHNSASSGSSGLSSSQGGYVDDGIDARSQSGSRLRKTKPSLGSLRGMLPGSSSHTLKEKEKDKEKEKEKDKEKDKDKDKSTKRRSVGRPKGKEGQPQFEELLSDTKLYRTLETKLLKEHSVEYLHFYRAVTVYQQKFASRSVVDNVTEAKYIETLLCNVSGDDRLIDQIKTKIANSNPDATMFADILGEVASILRTKFLSL